MRAVVPVGTSYRDSLPLNHTEKGIGSERSALDLLSRCHDTRNDSITLKSNLTDYLVNLLSETGPEIFNNEIDIEI